MAEPREGTAPGEVICHNDVCPENVVYRGGTAVALLDFDFAAPGSRVYDLARLALMTVPVDTPEDAARTGRGDLDPFARLRVVADAYGLAPVACCSTPSSAMWRQAVRFSSVTSTTGRRHSSSCATRWRAGALRPASEHGSRRIGSASSRRWAEVGRLGRGATVSDDGSVTTDTDPAATASTRAPEPGRRMHPRLRSVLGWVVFVLAVVLVSTVARAYAVQTYFVPTPSMTPTLIPGDRIVVDKLASTIHRGDIVVSTTSRPTTVVPSSGDTRPVIGLPGETISSVGATVLINGKPLPEAFLPPLTGICAEVDEHIKTTKIPPGHYFMIGATAGDSGDSRYWGTVPASYIIGKVDLIIWRNGHPWFHWF